MKIQVIKQQREFRRRLGGGVLVEGSTCRAIWAVISNRNQIHYQESHLSVRRRFGDWGVGRSTAFETCKTEGKLGEGPIGSPGSWGLDDGGGKAFFQPAHTSIHKPADGIPGAQISTVPHCHHRTQVRATINPLLWQLYRSSLTSPVMFYFSQSILFKT